MMRLLPVAGITILAALIRLLGLGVHNVLADQSPAMAYARLGWGAFLRAILSREAGIGLYDLLLRAWMMAGSGDAWIRLLGIIAGVATIPALYALGARLFGAPIGLIAAILLAVNAYHVRLSLDVGGYSLTILLVTLASVLFVRALDFPQGLRRWLGYMAASVLAVYSHPAAALVLASHWAAALVARRREAPWNAMANSAAVIGFLVAPVAVFFSLRHGGLPAITPDTAAGDTYRLLQDLSGSVGPAHRAGALLPAAYALAGLSAAVGVFRALRADARSALVWSYALTLAWLVVPLIIALAVSFWKPLIALQHLAVCLPPAALLAAVGVARLRNVGLVAAATAALGVLEGWALSLYFR